jgi:hypothetical protein
MKAVRTSGEEVSSPVPVDRLLVDAAFLVAAALDERPRDFWGSGIVPSHVAIAERAPNSGHSEGT